MGDDRIDVKVGAQTGELKAEMDGVAGKVKESAGIVQADFSSLEKTVTAQTDRIVAALNKTSAASQKASQETSKQLTGLKDVLSEVYAKTSGALDAITAGFNKATGVMAVFAEVMAGGAWFKSMIQDTISYVSEAKKLHEVMGININDAAAYNLAYKRVGVEHTDLENVLKRFQVQVRTNSERLKEMGVDVEDIRAKGGGLREMFEKSKEVIREHAEGFDRNMAAQEMWGARVNDVNKLLKVNADAVGNAKKFLKGLGLTIGPEMEKQIRLFKQGMVDSDTVMLALKVRVANEVLPKLRDLQNWFTGEGANAVKTFSSLVSICAAALGSLGTAAQWIGGSLNVWDKWQRSAKATQQVLADAGMASRPQSFAGSLAGITATGAAAGGDARGGGAEPARNKLWNNSPGGDNKAGTGGGPGLLQQWKEELEQLKDEDNRYLDYSKAEEKKFWQDKLAQCRAGSKEYTAVRHEMYLLEKAQAKEATQLEIARIKEQMASEKSNLEQRLAGQDRIIAINAKAYGEDSLNYQQALNEKKALQAQAEKEATQIEERRLQAQLQAAQAEFELERQKIAFKREMGLISGSQEVASLRQLKEQELLLEQQTLERIRTIWQGYPKERQRLDDQLAKLQQKSALELQKTEQQAAKATQQKWQQVMAPLNQALNTSVQGMIQGTQRLSQVINNALQNILVSYVSTAAQRLTNWAATELAMTGLSLAGATQRTTIQSAANAAAAGANAAQATQGIGSSAAEGAAAAYKAMAGIPVIGPALGAIAAAATFTAIIAYKAMIPSAAGGWDIPADSLAYVHKKEMILPEGLAERIRTMTTPRPAAAGGGDFNIHAGAIQIDARGASKDIDWDQVVRHKIIPGLKKAERNFVKTK